MARHISSIADSGIAGVNKEEFYRNVQTGDLVFCCGRAEISRAIEDVTSSIFSHVLMAWLPCDSDPWLTIESTMEHGVHIGLLSAYIDDYEGDLFLARRPNLTAIDLRKARDAGLRLLGDAYDWKQEVSIVGHKLLGRIPVEIPKNEYFCSGLQYMMSLATPFPLQRPGPNYPTPEELWRDPTVVPVCALKKIYSEEKKGSVQLSRMKIGEAGPSTKQAKNDLRRSG